MHTLASPPRREVAHTGLTRLELEVEGFYEPLLAFLDHAATAGFIRAEARELLVVDSDPAALLARMEAVHPPAVPRWLVPETT